MKKDHIKRKGLSLQAERDDQVSAWYIKREKKKSYCEIKWPKQR